MYFYLVCSLLSEGLIFKLIDISIWEWITIIATFIAGFEAHERFSDAMKYSSCLISSRLIIPQYENVNV